MKKFLIIAALLLGPIAYAQQSVTMSGHAISVAVTPTVTASSAYSSGNVVGGVMTFSVFRTGGGSGVLASCLLVDRANQKQPMTLLLFSKNPSHGTYTDKAAYSTDSTDMVSCIRQVTIGAIDYTTTGSYAVADISAIGKVAFNGESQSTSTLKNIYAVMVTTGTPTFNAATNITVKVGVLQD